MQARADLGHLRHRVFAAVLFDMDGTLVDSTPVVVRSWRRWAAEIDIPPVDIDGWHGVPSAQVVAALVPKSRAEAALRRIVEIEVGDVEGIEVLPGAAEALEAFASAPALLAIVTSCTRPLADARLAAAGIATPGVLVTADQVAVGKPDPEPYLLAAERLRVAPEDCLVVEDAPAGLISAAAAGAATLAVATTHDPDRLVADAVVPSLAAVRFVAGPDGVRIRPGGAGEQ